MLGSACVHAQKMDEDSLFQVARKNAEGKNYNLAIEQIKDLVSIDSSNLDYGMYLAQLYYWSEQYDLAQQQAMNVLAGADNYEAAFNLLVRIELAARKGAELLKHAEQGINLFPENKDFYILHKALALKELGREKEALLVIEQLDKSSNYYRDAQYVKNEILRQQKNLLSVAYLHTSFSNPGFAPWHFGTLEYLRKWKKISFIGRLNYGALFEKCGAQLELDAYPQLGKHSYLYLNTGVSDGCTVFPLVRLGFEYYLEYTKYSASLGGRHLQFNTDKVLMWTGHLSRNFQSYRLTYRPFVVLAGKGWFDSHILNFRKSFERKESFVQLDLQYGAVPYYFFVSEEFLRTSAYRAGINCKWRMKDNFFVQPILMYEWEEYVPNSFRNRFNLQVVLSKRF